MERVAAGDVEARNLGIRDLDAVLVGPRIERALDFEPGLGRRRADQFDHGEVRWSINGRPRQFCVMWQNSWCSILFHFDVPGG